MIALTKKYLEHVCVSSHMPNSDLVARLQARSIATLGKLKAYIPETILAKLPEPEDPAIVYDDPDKEMYRVCASYLAAQTYRDALDELNLVLTPTGFGVVSNQNVAPASMERINALRASLDQLSSQYLSWALDLLRKRSDVPETYLWRFRMSMFWAPIHVAPLVEGGRPTWDDLARWRPVLTEAEGKVRVIVSPEQYGAILERNAHDSCTELDKMLMFQCLQFVLNYVHKQPVGHLIKTIVSILENNLESFPEYELSPTYAAAHRQTYENKKDSPGYFFHI